MQSSQPMSWIESRSAAVDEADLPRRIVAIADIHGMAGHFDRLTQETARIEVFQDAAYFILGDMVDRGPNARGVIDRVIALNERRPGSRTFAGNHDLWFLGFLNGDLTDDELLNWLSQGGSETLESYGVDDPYAVDAARRQVVEAAPDHTAFLERSESIALVGEFAFVHAGIDPRRPLDAQSRHDCAWIRAPFMRHEGLLSHLVVHGHTPQKGKRPTLTENRVSIDTGACFGGLLTAALIDRDAGTLDFLSTDGRDVFERTPTLTDRGFGTVRDRYRSTGHIIPPEKTAWS